VFRKFDKKNKGYVDMNDLRQMSIEVNEDMSDEVILEIMQKVDSNRDGKFTF
jgi:Ca2+-binding EF-hand superfamily protein